MPGAAAAGRKSFLRRPRLGAIVAAVRQRRAAALAALVFVAALPPVLLATWGYGRALRSSELGKLDLRLSSALDAAVSSARSRAGRAEADATALARTAQLQDALRQGDRTRLRQLVAPHPDLEILLPDGEVAAGGLPPQPRQVSRVDIAAGTASLGSVVAGSSLVPLAGSRGDVLVVVARNGRIVAGADVGAPLAATPTPRDTTVGGRRFRAAGVGVAESSLVALVPLGPTDATVRRRQLEMLLAVLATLTAISLGLTLLVRGRRRRGDGASSSSAAALAESVLGAVHDPDAMLGVVLETAVAVGNAGGGRLTWRGTDAERGVSTASGSSLELPLRDSTGTAVGHLTLTPGDEGFDRDTAARVTAVVDRGIAALEAMQRQQVAQHQALTDELTELANRRRFQQALDVEVARSERSGTPLALVLGDLDGFKRINDEQGHQAGDEVLRTFARILAERVRTSDLPARLGGDEFAVLLPDTSLAGAVALAENLRTALSDEQVVARVGHVTASFGASALRSGGSGDELLREADEALYTAKRTGRDRVIARADAV